MKKTITMLNGKKVKVDRITEYIGVDGKTSGYAYKVDKRVKCGEKIYRVVEVDEFGAIYYQSV